MASRRRLLAVLLAFLVGAAMVLLVSGPASATGPDPTVELTADPGECSVELTVDNDAFRFAKIHYLKIVSADDEDFKIWGLYESGTASSWQYVHPWGSKTFTADGIGTGDYVAEVKVSWAGTWAWPYGWIPYEEQTATAPFTIDDQECPFEGAGFTGTIECDGPCSVQVLSEDPNAKADVRVLSQEFFKVTLTHDEWGPPGQATVEALEAPAGKNGFLPNCGKKGGTNCFHVNTVKVGGEKKLEFKVFWSDGDPRFKFG